MSAEGLPIHADSVQSGGRKKRKNRFAAPARDALAADVLTHPPLAHWREFDALLRAAGWPNLATLNELAAHSASRNPTRTPFRFVEQTRELLADGLHYERRIAERGAIATRTDNWHDLLNALVWLRYPRLKLALNARQVAEIAVAGPKARTRAQCALTHFDEAGVVVAIRDPALLAWWDAHDWHGLFWREREAWRDGRIALQVFGHALLEHALQPRQLLVGKALVATIEESGAGRSDGENAATDVVTAAILDRRALLDPQELRPLPLSGIPGWHQDNDDETFYRNAQCFRPLRAGRRYPAPLALEPHAPAPGR